MHKFKRIFFAYLLICVAQTGSLWKVFIFVWCLLRDRLPTKTNLIARGIISHMAHFCVSGFGSIKSAQRLFLSCSTFGFLWALVRSWISFSAADAPTIPDHLVQTFSVGDLRGRRSFLHLVWLACVWVVWNERNYRLFRNATCIVHQLLDKIKMFEVAGDNECFSSTEFSQLVVKLIALFEYRLIFCIFIHFLN
jgi:hypothetical protein